MFNDLGNGTSAIVVDNKIIESIELIFKYGFVFVGWFILFGVIAGIIKGVNNLMSKVKCLQKISEKLSKDEDNAIFTISFPLSILITFLLHRIGG